MDSYVLNGLTGTSLQIGTHTMAEPAVDFGTKDLFQTVLNENPLIEGGQYAYEQAGVRHMSFPLIVPSGAFGGLSLTQAESIIRDVARPGASIDIQAHGVASSDAVRFDILGARLEEQYVVHEQRESVRHTTLFLDVEPYGYSPTWIILASSASVGLPGVLAIPSGAIIGDGPGQVELYIAPQTPATTFGSGSWYPDSVLWSLGACPSFQAFLQAGSWAADQSFASVASYGYSPDGKELQVQPMAPPGWIVAGHYLIPQAIEPAYRGHFHAYGFFRARTAAIVGTQSPLVSLDVVANAAACAPLASTALVASIMPFLAASPGHELIDLGPVTIPAVGSGLAQDVRLRLWYTTGTYLMYASSIFALAGVYLQPADAPAGVLVKGLAQPTVAAATIGRLALSSADHRALIALPTGALEYRYPLADTPYYRGVDPYVGASTIQLDVLAANRRGAFSFVYENEVLADGPDYYYTFDDMPAATTWLGLPTITDSSGNARTATNTNPSAFQGASGLLFPAAGVAALNPTGGAFSNVGVFASVGSYFGGPTAQWSVDFWAAMFPAGVSPGQATVSGNAAWIGHGLVASAAAQFGWLAGYNLYATNAGGTGVLNLTFGGSDILSATALTVGPMHIAVECNQASRCAGLYLNGVLVASKTLSASYHPSPGAATQPLSFMQIGGNLQLPAAGQLFPMDYWTNAAVDEIAVYSHLLGPSRIWAHYAAGASSQFSQGIGTDMLVRTAPGYAAASIRYRPRFQFLKGL